MYYPLILQDVNIQPLFGELLEGDPYIFDFSSKNPKTLEYDANDFEGFDQLVFDELKVSGMKWGIGRYLEERKNLLRHYPNIIEEKRYYHLGLDIVVPFDTAMYAPLDSVVHKVGKETKVGNYGGYVMLGHELKGVKFYSFYGHLKTPHSVKEGDKIKAGEEFARIGKESDSGGWFCHVHLQILTQAAIDDGYMDWGYINPELFPQVEKYFPSPYFLFKY
ncbi:MAG: peptidoglycan DD-metalloendopeptidase family protein [Flavobacteriales bacterium]|nr:peptidoglycan DD-metalloendopeptidase family protein [Flavobacteriales bacterium]